MLVFVLVVIVLFGSLAPVSASDVHLLNQGTSADPSAEGSATGGAATNPPPVVSDVSWQPLAAAVFVAAGRVETGEASWYGPGFYGNRTANGEVFRDYAEYTAAHQTLPFGTRVRVTNLKNGRTITVRINDRGPFHGGRIIDLNRSAAAALGISGVAPVRLEY